MKKIRCETFFNTVKNNQIFQFKENTEYYYEKIAEDEYRLYEFENYYCVVEYEILELFFYSIKEERKLKLEKLKNYEKANRSKII